MKNAEFMSRTSEKGKGLITIYQLDALTPLGDSEPVSFVLICYVND